MAVRNEATPKRYECLDCGDRTEAESHVGRCPSCGGRVRNLSVPREQ